MSRYTSETDDVASESEQSLESATITVETLSLSFGDLSVLEDVSLTVDPGEFVGFVGPNGAGKTTLLRAISGALEPDSGTVTIGDTDVHDASSKASSRLVSVVPQDTSLSFSFPVRDVVEMGRHPHRSRFSGPTSADREAVERALERTRTAELADRPIDEVSGGQRQRVVLARAVAQETPAMLLDEPTASLDVNHQIETLELVRELVDEGRTVCAAIHDLDLAARYCDRLVMLADGSVHREGPPSAVLTAETLAEAFDANAVVTPNPITGSETVTALPNDTLESADSNEPDGALESTDGNESADTGGSNDTSGSNDTGESTAFPGRVHVLGTGSAAAGVVARLEAADTETEVTLGPVSSGDAAAETARSLGVGVLEIEPFARLSSAELDAAERRIRDADVTVLADLVLGAGNQMILESLEASDSLVVVETRSFTERNFAGTAARKRYEACQARAVETTVGESLEAVVEAYSDRSRSQSSPIDSADD